MPATRSKTSGKAAFLPYVGIVVWFLARTSGVPKPNKILLRTVVYAESGPCVPDFDGHTHGGRGGGQKEKLERYGASGRRLWHRLDDTLTTEATLDELNDESFRQQVAEELQNQANASECIIDERLVRTALHKTLDSAGMVTERPRIAVEFGRRNASTDPFMVFPTYIKGHAKVFDRLPDLVLKLNAEVKDIAAIQLSDHNLYARAHGLASPAIQLMLKCVERAINGHTASSSFDYLVQQLVDPQDALTFFKPTMTFYRTSCTIHLHGSGLGFFATTLPGDTPASIVQEMIDSIHRDIKPIIESQTREGSSVVEARLRAAIDHHIDMHRKVVPRLCDSPRNTASCTERCTTRHHCISCGFHVPHDYMYGLLCVWCKVRSFFLYGFDTTGKILVKADLDRGRQETWNEADLAAKNFKIQLPMLMRAEVTEADLPAVFSCLGLELSAISLCTLDTQPRTNAQAKFYSTSITVPSLPANTITKAPTWLADLLPSDYIGSIMTETPAIRIAYFCEYLSALAASRDLSIKWKDDGTPNWHADGQVYSVPKFFNMSKGPHSPLRPLIVMLSALVKHGLPASHDELRTTTMAKLSEFCSPLRSIDAFFATGQTSDWLTVPAVRRIVDVFYGDQPLSALQEVLTTLLAVSTPILAEEFGFTIVQVKNLDHLRDILTSGPDTMDDTQQQVVLHYMEEAGHERLGTELDAILQLSRGQASTEDRHSVDKAIARVCGEVPRLWWQDQPSVDAVQFISIRILRLLLGCEYPKLMEDTVIEVSLCVACTLAVVMRLFQRAHEQPYDPFTGLTFGPYPDNHPLNLSLGHCDHQRRSSILDIHLDEIHGTNRQLAKEAVDAYIASPTFNLRIEAWCSNKFLRFYSPSTVEAILKKCAPVSLAAGEALGLIDGDTAALIDVSTLDLSLLAP